MKKLSFLISIVLFLGTQAKAQTENLIPNPDLSAPGNPLQGWRINFPWEDEWYAQNGKYISPATEGGRTCALFDCPAAIAANQGAKIESAFIKIVPGARYHVSVDCMPLSLGMKVIAEVWTLDPKPGIKADKWRVPAEPDHPALLTCYRAQLPDPKGPHDQWQTVQREITIPPSVFVLGKPQDPVYLTLKVVVFSGGKAGKASVTGFLVRRIP